MASNKAYKLEWSKISDSQLVKIILDILNKSAMYGGRDDIKGVGPTRAKLLNKIGIYNLGDLL